MRQTKKVSSASIAAVGAIVAASVVTSTGAFAQTAAPAAPPPPAPGAGEAAKPPPPDQEEHERSAKNAVYAEGLGPGLFYSINYDRAFSDFALRVGVGYVSLSSPTDPTTGQSASVTFLSVPVTVSYLGIGSLKHMLELGAGGSLIYFGGKVDTLGNSTSGSAVGGVGTLIVGYRFQPPDGGFLLRAGLSPLISSTGGFLPWPYLGLGGTF